MHTLQTKARSSCRRLAVETESCRKEDKESSVMKFNIDAIMTMANISICMSVYDIHKATQDDMYLHELRKYIIRWWLSNSNEVKQELRPYWTLRDELAMIYSMTMKGRRVTIPSDIQPQAVEQLYIHLMGMKNKASSKEIHILDKFECRSRKYCKEFLIMSWISADTAK